MPTIFDNGGHRHISGYICVKFDLKVVFRVFFNMNFAALCCNSDNEGEYECIHQEPVIGDYDDDDYDDYEDDDDNYDGDYDDDNNNDYQELRCHDYDDDNNDDLICQERDCQSWLWWFW